MTVTPWTQRIVLHDHLDGSATLVPILPRLFELSGKEYPFDPNGDIQGDMVKLFKDPQIDIVNKFSNTTGVMQSRETISLVVQNYVRVRALQGFKYCEATVAPQYHIFGGLTVVGVLEALIEGIKKGEKEFPNVEVNLLFTVGREVNSEEAVRLVNIAKGCDRSYVVGIGLVCDEWAHPPEKHKAMFKRAKELGFKTTCHAGEWCHHPAKGKADWLRDQYQLLKNIEVAIFELGVDRLGHAIPLAYNQGLMRAVRDRNISIEGCPGSNLSSGLIPSTRYLRINELLSKGVNYSLNPDDDLFMPNLNEVFQICNAEYHFTEEERQKLLRNPWLARFGNRKEHKF
jgi:adenosine deaminase